MSRSDIPASADTLLPRARALWRPAGVLAWVAVVAGLAAALAFIIVGLRFGLQLYGDGAVFSYAVATQSAWAVHWHNIANRSVVYLLSLAPAEAYVRAAQDPAGGIALYGALFFGAPLAGLLVTFAADRSAARAIFVTACAATAGLAPLVFGFPTEMWVAHALFWPALALAHHAPRTRTGFALVLVSLAALMFAHEAALVPAFALVLTLLLHGRDDPRAVRGALAFALVFAAWLAVKLLVPPDGYFAPVLADARLNFFNPLRLFADRMLLLLGAALAGYGLLWAVLARTNTRNADIAAAMTVLVVLMAYWGEAAPPLHAVDRYFLRTGLVLALPVLGALAALVTCACEAQPGAMTRRLARPLAWLARRQRMLAIGLLIVVTVHVVETARFVRGWTDYVASVRTLAAGTASDPALGDARFVSSARIAEPLQQLAWSSTTPFLSVLTAPNFRPSRLVVDPAAGYFWLSCALASAGDAAGRAVPAQARDMLRVYACQHRRGD